MPRFRSPCGLSRRQARRGSAAAVGPLTLAGILLVLWGGASRAQPSPSPNQPLAIPEQVRMQAPCPLIVSSKEPALQPLRIAPSQVAAKNALGCLSPADAAAYGPDGCPLRLCGPSSGIMPLPQR